MRNNLWLLLHRDLAHAGERGERLKRGEKRGREKEKGAMALVADL